MDLINSAPQQGHFIRRTGHTITSGRIVAYTLVGSPRLFQIQADRDGVEIRGQISVGSPGVEALRDVLQRAARHHEHLKSFAIGETQTILEETDLFTSPDSLMLGATKQ